MKRKVSQLQLARRTYHEAKIAKPCGKCKFCAERSTVHDDEFWCVLKSGKVGYYGVDDLHGTCDAWTKRD